MKKVWLLLLAIVILAVLGFASLNALRGSAAEQPGPVETAIARRLRPFLIPSSAAGKANPIPDSPAVQAEAREHWADHCAGCHANDGSGTATMGKRMYPPAPDMRTTDTQRRSDGELFYIIENGVRLTGMPGWGSPGGDGVDSWKLVRFIRHLPKLTAEEIEKMKSLNPKTPADLAEEQQEKDFLAGRDVPAPAQHHHH